MALRTESGEPLLTEAGHELLAESETAGEGGEGSEGGGVPIVSLQAQATLTLSASANATLETVILVGLHSAATLTLSSVGHLLKQRPLKAQATLKLHAKTLAANALPGPRGLNAQMKIITDPHNPALILDQSLLLWFHGHPSQCQVSVQMDDEPEFQPAWTWENPGHTQPAILRIDSAEIPGDGMTHRLTIYARYAISGKTSAPATIALSAKTTHTQLQETPEWCGATLIRQGEAYLADLTEVQWRHPGAVKIVAQYKVLNTAKTGWIDTERTVGYADHDDDACLIEDLGTKIWTGSNAIRNVTFGVAAISKNQFGPIQWAAQPLGIQSRNPLDTHAPTPIHPDQATQQSITGEILPRQTWAIPTPFTALIRAAVADALGTLPSQGHAIIDQALYRSFLKIKHLTRQGGTVTLDDLGTFETRWNADRTARSIRFIPSIGFKEGTKQGTLLTDAEAKA